MSLRKCNTENVEIHLLVVKNESELSNKLSVIAVIFKGEKAESLAARLAVHHYRGVNDLSIFGKEGRY